MTQTEKYQELVKENERLQEVIKTQAKLFGKESSKIESLQKQCDKWQEKCTADYQYFKKKFEEKLKKATGKLRHEPLEVGNKVRVTKLGAEVLDLDVSIPGTVTKVVSSNDIEVHFDCYNAPIKVKRNHVFISE